MTDIYRMKKSKAVYKTKEGRFYIIDIQKALLWKTKLHLSDTVIAERSGMVSPSVIQRFFQKCRGGGEDGTVIKVDMVSAAQAIGMVMCNDANALLIEITSIIETAIEEKGELPGIRGVYDSLNRILYEMLTSSFYNFIPDGSMSDGYEYYEERLQEVRMQIQRDFLGNQEVKQKLHNIVDEITGFVKSYSIPDGVANRWSELNPRLRYFDPAYDFYTEHRAMYEDIAAGRYACQDGLTIGFGIEVTAESAKERERYFEEAKRKYEKRHEKFDEDKAFREEMTHTLELVFEMDFAEAL